MKQQLFYGSEYHDGIYLVQYKRTDEEWETFENAHNEQTVLNMTVNSHIKVKNIYFLTSNTNYLFTLVPVFEQGSLKLEITEFRNIRR